LKLEKVFKMGMVLGYYASTDRQTFVPKRAFKTWIILVYTRFSGHFFSTGLTVLVTQKILISCRLIRVRIGCSILTLLLNFLLGVPHVVWNALKKMCDFLFWWNVIFRGPPAWKTRENAWILCITDDATWIKLRGPWKYILGAWKVPLQNCVLIWLILRVAQ